MATKGKAETGILASVHKTAVGLHKSGLIDKATMREFDALCLTPVEPLTADLGTMNFGEPRRDGGLGAVSGRSASGKR